MVSWSAAEKRSRRWKQGVLTPLQLLWVDSRVSSDQIWLKVWLFHFLRTHIWCLSLGTKVEIFLSTHAKSWSTNVKLHKWTDTIYYSMQHILFLIWFLQHGHMYFIIGTFVFFSNWGSYYLFNFFAEFLIKSIYSEKATKFCKISTIDLTVTI